MKQYLSTEKAMQARVFEKNIYVYSALSANRPFLSKTPCLVSSSSYPQLKVRSKEQRRRRRREREKDASSSLTQG